MPSPCAWSSHHRLPFALPYATSSLSRLYLPCWSLIHFFLSSYERALCLITSFLFQIWPDFEENHDTPDPPGEFLRPLTCWCFLFERSLLALCLPLNPLSFIVEPTLSSQRDLLILVKMQLALIFTFFPPHDLVV